MRLLSIGALSIASLLVNIPAMAQSQENERAGFYLGVGVTESNYEESYQGLSFDGEGTGFKVLAGFAANQYIQIEAAFLNIGKLDDTISGVNVEFDATAWQVALLPTLPINDRAAVFLKASMIGWEYDAEARIGNVTVTQTDDGNDFAYGFGLQFGSRGAGVRVEYELAELGDNADFSMLSATLRYQF